MDWTLIALVAIALLLAGSTALQAKTTLGKPAAAPPLPVADPRKASILKRAAPYLDIFERLGTSTGVPIRLMLSIVQHETGGTWNPRSENEEKKADLRRGRDVDSVGLAQILWPDTAQALRPGTTKEELFDPTLNLSLAFKLMQGLLRVWSTKDSEGFPAQAVAAYNGGKPRYESEGVFKNQEYVDSVRKWWRVLA